MLVYGVIPARGGSRGLPGKNLKLLCGEPLIAHIIKAALTANTLDKVYVSTDTEEIADVAQDYGANVIVHPARLSTPTASTFGVIRNSIEVFHRMNEWPDILVTMRPTAPLCLSRHINRAVRRLVRCRLSDSVISVVKSDTHPFRVLRINREGELEHFDRHTTEKDFPQRRQSFGNVYVRNGAIYATRTRTIERGSLWGIHSIPFIMPKERSVNINDEADFLFAETLMKRFKKALT